MKSIFRTSIKVDPEDQHIVDKYTWHLHGKSNQVSTQHQQVLNRGVFKNSKSGYKGVNWHKQSEKFRATIQIDGRKIHIGSYDTAEKAAVAYDEAALKYHGEFAVINGDRKVQGVKK